MLRHSSAWHSTAQGDTAQRSTVQRSETLLECDAWAAVQHRQDTCAVLSSWLCRVAHPCSLILHQQGPASARSGVRGAQLLACVSVLQRGSCCFVSYSSCVAVGCYKHMQQLSTANCHVVCVMFTSGVVTPCVAMHGSCTRVFLSVS